MTPEFLEFIIALQLIQFALAVIVFLWIAIRWVRLEILIKETIKK